LLVTFAFFVTGISAFAGEGLVKLQTADASCMPPWFVVGRYFDCGNGTVLDRNTGLVWLANADCFGILDWHEAVEVAGNLSDLNDRTICGGSSGDECDCGLSDNSSPGEWRLPSASEWKAMVSPAICQDPALTDDHGLSCWTQECSSCSFYNVRSSWYWSASTNLSSPSDYAHHIFLGTGFLYTAGSKHLDSFYVWPVRYGQ
jgi:hypothetical protein